MAGRTKSTAVKAATKATIAAQKLLAAEAAKNQEEVVEVKPAAPLKGKATKGQGKVKAAKIQEEEIQEEVSGNEKVKRTRKPSMFNLFMKDRLAEMKEDSELMEQLPVHKDRFKQAAAEWKEMPEDEKETLKAELMDKYADELAAPVEKPAKKPAKPKATKATKAKPVPEPIPESEDEEEEDASDDEEEASDDEE
jgi:hypothetical protein